MFSFCLCSFQGAPSPLLARFHRPCEVFLSGLFRSLKTIQLREVSVNSSSHPLPDALSVPAYLFFFPAIPSLDFLAVRPGRSLRCSHLRLLPRKEVIQPHLPIRLPCYDFTPVIGLTFGAWLLSVTSATSGATNSHGVTGGVYKARERIHRGMLIRDY